MRGFTLIELLIVVAIIGIVVAIAMPAFLDARDKAKQRATVAELRNWGNGLADYYAERGTFPVATGNINDARDPLVPFSVTVVKAKDFWEHDFHYFASDSLPANSYTIESWGKDNVEDPPGLENDPTWVRWPNFNLDLTVADGVFSTVPG